MKRFSIGGMAAVLACLATGAAAEGVEAPGQDPFGAEMSAFAAAIGATNVTARSHSVPTGGSIFNGEGQVCPSGRKMVSGACHPGYTDGVRIINQYPNLAGNAWRCGFSNTTGSNRTAWVYTLCAEDTPSGPPLVVHDLQVRRFTSTALADARADAILVDATNVIQTDSGANDIACNVGLRRTGAVTTFSTGDGSIDSATEFTDVNNLPGNVKVLNQINWCGGIGANIIGCAPVPGDSLVVVRFVESLEGILWLHEFGHNQGLSHRNGTDNVMHPSIGSDRVGVDVAECTAYRSTALVAATGGTQMALLDVAAAGESGAPPEDVRDFVRQYFVHGTPFDQASRYGPEAVPVLLEMLDDPAEVEWWPNIVTVLGMIGEPTVFEPLKAFLEEPTEGTLTRPHYQAKANVPLALGYLVNQSGNEAALDYLIEGADPGFWQGQVMGRASFQASTAERNEDMAQRFVLGLALTGKPRALQALQALESGERSVAGGFAQRAESTISGAIAEHNKIAEQGLEAYDRSRHGE